MALHVAMNLRACLSLLVRSTLLRAMHIIALVPIHTNNRFLARLYFHFFQIDLQLPYAGNESGTMLRSGIFFVNP
jgi:hypothetical protein